ncbi:hypothetical protein OH76DRAFT_1490001 [Lentinus brumalis]|uniref:Uncharacterized protein n=1 Tax=Lentinus brumalis TaxID=2498619 RepID=A0A371CKH9_9APHY|nr:hypothetical protein OH76DRAFT_1490001 [Polyporus brumalis]
MRLRANPSDSTSKKLLRAARNRRYYEKRKRLQAVRERLATANKHNVNSTILGPLIIPKSLSLENTSDIRALNARVNTWGIIDDQNDFTDRAAEELARVKYCPRLLAKWIRIQDGWLMEGHSILEDMQAFMSGTATFELNPLELRELLRSVMDTAYKMQWMMVGIELALQKVDGGP